MSHITDERKAPGEMKALLERIDFKISGGFKSMLLLFVAIGVVGFIVGIISDHPHYAWQALLTNTVFFTGLSFGGLMYSVIWTVTDAKWSRPMKRWAEACVSFAPIGFLLFIVLLFGAEHFYEWVDHDKVIHSKAGWLDMGFFVKRNVILFLIVMAMAWAYLKIVLRPDIGLAKSLTGFSNKFADKFIKNYGDQSEEEEISFRKAHRLAPSLGFAWALMASLIAFDWIMSIDQEWFSTMFGVQYLIAGLIKAMCFLIIVTGIFIKKYDLGSYITTSRYHDMGKFTFAACLLWTYMIFSQVLPIWYGNMPEEAPYIMLRMNSLEWSWMFWLIFAMMFIIPFFGLMSRTACNSVFFSRIIAIDILIGMWLEKYFMIVPSMQENMVSAGAHGGAHGAGHGVAAAGPMGLPGVHFTIYDVSITLGVLGLFLLSYTWFLSRVPFLPVSDRHFFHDNPHGDHEHEQFI